MTAVTLHLPFALMQALEGAQFSGGVLQEFDKVDHHADERLDARILVTALNTFGQEHGISVDRAAVEKLTPAFTSSETDMQIDRGRAVDYAHFVLVMQFLNLETEDAYNTLAGVKKDISNSKASSKVEDMLESL